MATTPLESRRWLRAPLRATLLLVAAATGFVGGACKDDDDGVDSDDGAQFMVVCKNYCARAELCNDNINEEKCISRCVRSVENCMADEQDLALYQIDVCASESCNDLIGCSINAGAQCYFGL